MVKNNKKAEWVKKHISDTYVKKSKQSNYRSRAAFKLKNIDQKYNFLSNTRNVIDLGCAPGSWLQVLKEYKNIKLIVGVDLLDFKSLEKVEFYRCDIRNSELISEISSKYNCKFDLVLSDIAPNITGISDIDQANFYELAENISNFCKFLLIPGGMLVMKYFLGANYNNVNNLLRDYFKKISVFKPDASKRKSSEIYLICNDYKDNMLDYE